jgi:Fur family ferric uptake transcriptional regulator
MSDQTVGQRNSPQRAAITRVILAADGPLTIEEVHQQARELHRGLGIATVYRNVKLLLEAGVIKSVVLPDGDTRYEGAELGHHHHFRCRLCRSVFDIDHCPITLPKTRELPGGFRVEGHDLTLYGICPACG